MRLNCGVIFLRSRHFHSGKVVYSWAGMMIYNKKLACSSGRLILSILSAVTILLTGVSCTILSSAIGGGAPPTTIAPTVVIALPGETPLGTPAGYSPAIFGSPLDPTPQPPATPTPTPQATPGPPLPPPTVVVALPPVDFEAARATAQAQGLDLAFVKIGFHLAVTGNAKGWGDYLRQLNDAGVPVFVKSADAGGPIFEAQQLMKANEAAGRQVDHTLVFRLTDPTYEEPFYNRELEPETAAAISWQLNRDNLPPELDKEYFWLETLNEPGRYGSDEQLQIEWLGRFSLATAKLAVAEGYRYAAFAFSTGVPGVGDWTGQTPIDPNDWEDPAMLDFLRFAGQHPEQVAVALHEYSLTTNYIGAGYPFLVGRLQALFDVCDRHGIPRPTVLITEWGWEYNNVPAPVPALEDIAWASWLYAAYPNVKGAAIWYLGSGFGSIDDQTQRLIKPLADYAVSHYFIIDPGQGRIDPELFRLNPPTLLDPSFLLPPTPYPRPSSMPEE